MKIKLDANGRPTGLIKFTKRQQAAIGLLLATMRDCDGEAAILGQVFRTGIACKVCMPAEAAAIAAITGANNGALHCSSPEQHYPAN